MKAPSRWVELAARASMFLALAALTLYLTHFILPGGVDAWMPDVALNPLLRVGLFIVLTIGGALVAFWIMFGDIVNREEKKP